MRSTNQRKHTADLQFPFGNHRPRCPAAERICHSSVHPINKSSTIIHVLFRNILNLQLLLWIIFVSCRFDYCLSETSRPLNLAAVKGDKVQLDCSTKEKENGYWIYTKPFESKETTIYDVDKVISGLTTLFSVNDSVQGHFNLLFNASESTSGKYTCQPAVNLADQSAEVIVLETSPNCSMTVTSGIVNASCSIDFNGNWAPEIQWHNMNGRMATNDTTTLPNRRVTSFLIVPLNQTEPGAEYILTCTPTFVLKSKPQETTATNVPDLLNNCTLRIGSSYATSTQPTTTPPTPPPPSPLSYTIAIVVCVCVGVIATTLFIIVFLCRRKKCTNSSKEKDPLEGEPMTQRPSEVKA